MSPAEAMEQIERPQLSALVNLASNLKTFLRTVADQPGIQTVAMALQTPERIAAVAGRVAALAAQPGEDGHEHPADAALAASLWLLSQLDQEQAELVAGALAGVGHFWWARKVGGTVGRDSRRGLDGKTELPEDGTQEQQISGVPSGSGA
ncbi:MAG: hypothetical protein L0Z62_26630 [Gemmataceae bacterium]|nr:hypothetical protein [Gemmataceae bacterium]